MKKVQVEKTCPKGKGGNLIGKPCYGKGGIAIDDRDDISAVLSESLNLRNWDIADLAVFNDSF